MIKRLGRGDVPHRPSPDRVGPKKDDEIMEEKAPPQEFPLESTYPHHQLHDGVRGVFTQLYYGLRDLREIVADAINRDNFDKRILTAKGVSPGVELPASLVGWAVSINGHGWWWDIDAMPMSEHWQYLSNRFRSDVKWEMIWRALHVAQHGFLSMSAATMRGDTRFESVSMQLAEKVDELAQTGVDEWHITRQKRAWISRWWNIKASAMRFDDLIVSAETHLTIMWDYCLEASCLLDRPDNEFRVLVDGTYIFDRLTALMAEATERYGIVPKRFADSAKWKQFASLLEGLIDLAGPSLGKSDPAIIAPLTEAMRHAESAYELCDTEDCNNVIMDIENPIAFETAYRVLRGVCVAEIGKLIPDMPAYHRSIREIAAAAGEVRGREVIARMAAIGPQPEQPTNASPETPPTKPEAASHPSPPAGMTESQASNLDGDKKPESPPIISFCRVSDIADRLDSNADQVRRWCRDGDIPAAKKDRDTGEWLVPTNATRPKFTKRSTANLQPAKQQQPRIWKCVDPNCGWKSTPLPEKPNVCEKCKRAAVIATAG